MVLLLTSGFNSIHTYTHTSVQLYTHMPTCFHIGIGKGMHTHHVFIYILTFMSVYIYICIKEYICTNLSKYVDMHMHIFCNSLCTHNTHLSKYMFHTNVHINAYVNIHSQNKRALM